VPSLRDSSRDYNAPRHLRAGLSHAAPSGLDHSNPRGSCDYCDILKDPKLPRAVERARLQQLKITFPKPTGLGNVNRFFALSIIVLREHCGDGSLGRADRFDCLRGDGWTFYSVAGKSLGDELKQTFHRGSWHHK
jgi:hypothetical protein